MNKYLATFTVHIQEAIIYRVRLFIWLLTDIVWIVVLPFVWLSVYGDASSIGGYDKNAIVSYFFYMPLVNSLLTYYTYHFMSYQIKDGAVVSFITKPIQYLLYCSIGEIAYRLWQTGTVVLLISIAYVFVGQTIIVPTLPENLVAIIPIFLTTMVMNLLFATLIGMIGFWTIQAEWIFHFWWMITTFATGYLAPLSFYPYWTQVLLYYSPFPLMMHVPLEAILGRLGAIEIIHWVVVGLVWIVILLGLNRMIWQRGVRRVDTVGM